MALSDLIARLDQEAHSRVEAIEQAAAADVRAIEIDAERKVQEITARELEHGRAERQVARERELAFARRQARAGELGVLHRQIRGILTRARSLVPEVAASAPFIAALPAHLEQALLFVEGLHPRVRCQAGCGVALAPIAARCGAQLEVDERAGPGVIVEASDGSVRVDNTLTARLARAERRLTIELARALREAASAASANRHG
jgi:V/A-type H+-transporting ATPase subunit E